MHIYDPESRNLGMKLAEYLEVCTCNLDLFLSLFHTQLEKGSNSRERDKKSFQSANKFFNSH